MEQHAVRRAWEKFVHGETPEGVRDAVSASWMRSRELHILTDRREAPLAPEPELYRRRAENTALLQAARPALARSRVFLADASSMMILAEPSGLIIETEGDPRVIDAGRRNHLEKGGRWNEGDIGTNAIGTALAAALPVQIHGAEHFCEDVQRWTCAAAPIRHPLDGELLGVIDISGPAAAFNPQSLALAVTAGQEIEAALAQAAKAQHEVLFRHFVSKRSLWLSEDMLVIDRRGLIVHATENAHREVSRRYPGVALGKAAAALGVGPPESWQERLRELLPHAGVEIVRSDDETLGAIVLLHAPRRRPAASAPLRQPAEPPVGFDAILGESAAMREARERARRLAGSGVPILIEGETGVGKEVFARAIHGAGPASAGPFVPVNCGGMARDLVASELFGYASGAFTGADAHGRSGRIEAADGGLLCLDEIGEMPLDLQPYLLRVLEDGVVYRIGAHEGRRVDVRVVSMTNRSLIEEVETGRFRRDLYYRVAAARLKVPPLRERGDDICLLAEHFVRLAAGRLDRPVPRLAEAVLLRLRQHAWPGNVRELRNVVETMVALASGEVIGPDDVPPEIAGTPDPGLSGPSSASPSASLSAAPAPTSPQHELKAAERAMILACVKETGGNLTEAAKRLGIARSTLYLRLAEYGLPRPPKV